MTDEEIAREFGLEPTEALSAALRRVRVETLEEAEAIICNFTLNEYLKTPPAMREENWIKLSGEIMSRLHKARVRKARASNAPKEGE